MGVYFFIRPRRNDKDIVCMYLSRRGRRSLVEITGYLTQIVFASPVQNGTAVLEPVGGE
jgi:thiamine phosphate synthase YjbQ (UPF0047 family)